MCGQETRPKASERGEGASPCLLMDVLPISLGVGKKSIDWLEEVVRKLKFFLVLWVVINNNNHIKEI